MSELRRPVSIDDSPPGSWRAAIAERAGLAAACAVCRQSTCHHPDAEYLGAAPLLGPAGELP